MKIKKICVISPGYPDDKMPWFPFVDQLICAISDFKVECTVIAPQSVTKGLKDHRYRRPVYWEKKHNGNNIKIYQPYYVSLSKLRFRSEYISNIFFKKSVISYFWL